MEACGVRAPTEWQGIADIMTEAKDGAMQISFDDLRRAIGETNRTGWEAFISDLIHAEAWRVGIPPSEVSSGPTDRPDGGRDIDVKRGAPEGVKSWLPHSPSVWSVKSGADGEEPRTLRDELNEQKHPELIAQLRSGYVYRYCVCRVGGPKAGRRQAAKKKSKKTSKKSSKLARRTAEATGEEALDRAARALEKSLKLPNGRIECWWGTHLAKVLEHHPGLAGRVIPSALPLPARTHEQWGSGKSLQFRANNCYVLAESRRALEAEVQRHMRSNRADRHGLHVLHIAGLSGVGKSRLVLEATRPPDISNNLLYFNSFADAKPLLDAIRHSPEKSARVVIDECTLDEFDSLQRAVDECEGRLVVVSIGPWRRQGAGYSRERDGVHYLDEPDTSSVVIPVLEENGGKALGSDALRKIAEFAGADLRFALEILDEVKREPDVLSRPGELLARIARVCDSMYKRILDRHTEVINACSSFPTTYPWLTMSMNLGCSHGHEHELQYIAGKADKTEDELLAVIDAACKSGLGEQTIQFFEAVPRGLAVRIFADQLWPKIRSKFGETFKGAPQSMKPSILKRAELCPDTIRREVMSHVDADFRDALGTPSLETLVSQEEASTQLRAWAHVSSRSALDWLCQAIDGINQQTLNQAIADVEPWQWNRVRSDLWSMLTVLSSFERHYDRCEELLFKLALTEPVNHSSTFASTWAERHRLVWSNAQTSYESRIAKLLERHRAMTEASLPVLMEGFFQAIVWPQSVSRSSVVVDGQLIPPDWEPEGLVPYDELCRTTEQFLDVWLQLPPGLSARIARRVADNVDQVLRERVEDRIGGFLQERLDELESLTLRAKLSRLTTERQDDAPVTTTWKRGCKAWLDRFFPASGPEAKLKAMLATPLWDIQMADRATHGRTDPQIDEWTAPVAEAARWCIDDPSLLDAVQSLVDDPMESSTAWCLGEQLGKQDTTGLHSARVHGCMRAQSAIAFVGGYLGAIVRATGALPEWARATLDDKVTSAPQYVAEVTKRADVTQSGLDRILRCSREPTAKVESVLDRLYTHDWDEVMTDADRVRVIDRLWPADGQRDHKRGNVALQFVCIGLQRRLKAGIPSALVPQIERLVFDPPHDSSDRQGYEWKQLAEAWLKRDAERVLKFAVGHAIAREHSGAWMHREPFQLLVSAAETHGEMVAKVVVDSLIRTTEPGQVAGFLENWQDLLSKLPFEPGKQAIEANGIQAARKIARFVPDPRLDENGQPTEPALTHWLLTKHGGDSACFEEFEFGRQFRSHSGSRWETKERMAATLAKYKSHRVAALRRWAIETAARLEQEAEWDRVRYEELKHRRM